MQSSLIFLLDLIRNCLELLRPHAEYTHRQIFAGKPGNTAFHFLCCSRISHIFCQFGIPPVQNRLAA